MSNNVSYKHDLESICRSKLLLETETSDYLITDIIDILKPPHKKLEEYIAENGGIFKVSGEIDWSEPVGREIW